MDIKTITIIALLLLGASVVTQAATLSLVYSGNLDGELEPCGCSEQGDLGGIKRRVTLLDELRKKNKNLIAISSGGLIKAEGSADRIKSDFILQGFKAFNYDAIAVQWPDLVYGEQYISAQALPWVVTNWQAKPEKNGIRKFIEITRRLQDESVVIEFFAWLDPKASPLRSMQGDHKLVNTDRNFLSERVQSAKSKQHYTIVSTGLAFEQLQTTLPLKWIDIVIMESAYEEFSEPKKIANTIILQPGSRGMRIAKIELQIQQGKILKWQHEVLAMPESTEDSPRMLAWYAEYNAAVKKDYLRLSEVKKLQASGESPFAGEEACETCHASQYARWQSSDHADAFDDLELVGKSYDPACLQCHTVGFDKKGGFIDFAVTGDLMGVQCESCHGAARSHVTSGGKTAVSNKAWSKQKICNQCHTQPHSPGFSIKQYWPKIAH
ncbi:MAG: multiheme c-type cytochrome [Thiohalomonadales bacterium]